MAKEEKVDPASVNDIANYETALKELDQLVEQMEHGGLSLEDSLKKFERGISLIRNCQTTLKTAEQKVQILMGQNNSAELQPFTKEEEE